MPILVSESFSATNNYDKAARLVRAPKFKCLSSSFYFVSVEDKLKLCIVLRTNKIEFHTFTEPCDKSFVVVLTRMSTNSRLRSMTLKRSPRYQPEILESVLSTSFSSWWSPPSSTWITSQWNERSTSERCLHQQQFRYNSTEAPSAVSQLLTTEPYPQLLRIRLPLCQVPLRSRWIINSGTQAGRVPTTQDKWRRSQRFLLQLWQDGTSCQLNRM